MIINYSARLLKLSLKSKDTVQLVLFTFHVCFGVTAKCKVINFEFLVFFINDFSGYKEWMHQDYFIYTLYAFNARRYDANEP